MDIKLNSCKAINQLKKGGNVTPTNSSVHNDLADNYEKDAPEQMLLGKFEIKEGSTKKVLALSEELKTKTRDESGNLSFDYYLDNDDNTTIYFIEHYETGAGLTTHLEASYTTKFFANFAKQLESGYLADGQVTIYPVNTPESSIYIDQKNGIDDFKGMLKSMPDLNMELEQANSKGLQSIYITNQTDTKGFGSYLKLSNSNSGGKNWLYGMIEVDNKQGDINGISVGSASKPSQKWMDEAGANAKLLFQTPSLESSSNQPRSLQVNTGSYYLPFRTESENTAIFKANKFKPGIEIELPTTDELVIDEDHDLINYFGLNGKFGNVIQGMSKVTSLLQEEGFAVIDTSEQPRRKLHASFNGLDLNKTFDKIGLIRTNKRGKKLYDSSTDRFIDFNSNNADDVIRAAENSGELSFTKDKLIIHGGYMYSPIIKHDGEYFTPQNSTTRITGSNSFEMSVHDKLYDFSLIFSHSNDMPLMN